MISKHQITAVFQLPSTVVVIDSLPFTMLPGLLLWRKRSSSAIESSPSNQ